MAEDRVTTDQIREVTREVIKECLKKHYVHELHATVVSNDLCDNLLDCLFEAMDQVRDQRNVALKDLETRKGIIAMAERAANYHCDRAQAAEKRFNLLKSDLGGIADRLEFEARRHHEQIMQDIADDIRSSLSSHDGQSP